MGTFYSNNWSELYHYGIKGQKWGVRRYQNKDGTLTTAGKKRYRIEDEYKDGNDGRLWYDADKVQDYENLLEKIRSKSIDMYYRGMDELDKTVGKNAKKALEWEKKQSDQYTEKLNSISKPKTLLNKEKATAALVNNRSKIKQEKNLFKRAIYKARDTELETLANYAFINSEIDPAVKAYRKKVNEIAGDFMKEIQPRYASAILKDLGYEDTKAGREFLIKNNLVSLDD